MTTESFGRCISRI